MSGVGLYLTDVGTWACGPDGEWSDTAERSVLEFVDSIYIASPTEATPVISELGRVIAGAVARVTSTPTSLFLTVPTQWGRPRSEVFATAARGVAVDVTVAPSAVAIAKAYAAACEAVFGAQVWLIVEYTAAALVVSAVRFAAAVPSVLATDIETCLRTRTLLEVVDGLDTGQRIDAVLVSGDAGAEDVSALVDRFGRLDVHVVDPVEVARVLVPARAEGRRRPKVRGPRVVAGPAPRPRRRRAVTAGAAVVVATVAVSSGVYLALRHPGGAEVSGAADSGEALALGNVRVHLPIGWRVRTTAGAEAGQSARLEVVATEGPDRRIIVTQTQLSDGADYETVVDELARQIAEGGRDSKFGALVPDVQFGGRKTIEYRESPDVYSHVMWHVMVENDIQVSVGCQSLVGDWEVLAGDCEQLVRTMSIVP